MSAKLRKSFDPEIRKALNWVLEQSLNVEMGTGQWALGMWAVGIRGEKSKIFKIQ